MVTASMTVCPTDQSQSYPKPMCGSSLLYICPRYMSQNIEQLTYGMMEMLCKTMLKINAKLHNTGTHTSQEVVIYFI